MNNPVRILYLEDNPRDAELVQDKLQSGLACALRVAGNRAEYEAALGQARFDLILSDYSLPDYDGMAALSLARVQQPEVPFILISGTLGEEQAVDCVLRGATDFVLKQHLDRLVPAVLRALSEAEEHRKRRAAEATLRRSQAMLSRTEELAHIGSWEWEVATDTVTWSDELFRIFQRDPADGAPSFAEHPKFYHPEDRQRLQVAIEAAVGRGTPYELELRALRTDGTMRVCLARGHAETRPGEGATRLFGSLQDIDERKRAEESQARLAMAVEQAAETIVITDTNGTILYANPAFERIAGYTRAEAYGQNPRILQSGKQDAEFYRKMWEVLVAGLVWSGCLVNRRKDGTLYEEDATISPILAAGGRIVNYVAVKRDVTREVALEAQNRQAAKMEAVGQLAGGVAHDFNNQLTVVLGWTEMLRHELPPDHPFLASLQEIATAANRSAVLTRQLLTFSRQQAIAPVALDVNAGIADSMKMLGRLIGEDINLRFTRQPDLWRVFMDPGQWDQVLVNLVVNARDAIAGTGHIFIEAANRTLREADCRDQPDFVPPGDYVVVTFRDDGSGMTPEIQRHIFEPFFTTKGVGKGTGLGLATVYGIVKQNHGAIAVHSAPGQGTTFTLYLPRSSDVALAAPEPASARALVGTETVLVVEDEANLLNLVGLLLTQQGYVVLLASTPAEALRLCGQHAAPIQLLLSDVIMPKMGGKVLSERIQALRPGIRVLFMSGYSTEILEKQGHLPAGLHVLRKPFSSGILAQHVRAALDAPAGPLPL